MKRILAVLGFVALCGAFLQPNGRLHAQSLSVGLRVGHAGFFYSSLRSYGEWIEIEPGFHAWRPLRVSHGWRPYLNGRWSWTDYGWYWVSDEPFGWAVFHYGRWYLDDYYGWIWVPDDVWGPAWVEWRYNDDYLGWAPLPPYASFNISIGIRFTTRWYAPANYWCFVPYRHFGSNRIHTYVLNETYARRLIRTTRGAVGYEVDRGRIVNRGVDRVVIERRGNFRISRTEVGETRERGERIVRDGQRERIEVYRPSRTELDQREEHIEARRIDRRLSLDVNRIERNRSSENVDRRESESRPDRRDEATPTSRDDKTRQVRPETRRGQDTPLNRRLTPDRNEEFRSVQPQRPSTQQTPQRKDSRTVRPVPRSDKSPAARPPQRGTSKRGKDN